MHIRGFREDEDYDAFASFCAGHGKWAPTKDLLPRVGLVVLEDKGLTGGEEYPLAFVWVYKDPSSRLSWLGWLTTRPNLRPKRAREVCEFAVAMAKSAARAQTARVMFTETESAGLSRLYQRTGARVTHPINEQLAWAVSDRFQDGEAFVEASSQRAMNAEL